jgi:hypothetical protein
LGGSRVIAIAPAEKILRQGNRSGLEAVTRGWKSKSRENKEGPGEIHTEALYI